MSNVQRQNKTGFIKTQLPTLVISQNKDDAKCLVLPISMGECGNVEVNNQRKKRMYNRLCIPRKYLRICAECMILLGQ